MPSAVPGLVSCSFVAPAVASCEAPVTATFSCCRTLANPKSRILGVPAIGHENVRRLDVAVHDPFRVRGVQRIGNLHSHIQQRIGGHRLSADLMLQRLSFQKFHRQEGLAVRFLDVVNRADVRVVESGGGARFSLEPLQRLAVFRKFFRQKLQRDQPAEFCVLGLIDHAHAAAAEFVHDVVVGDGFVDHGALILSGGSDQPPPKATAVRRSKAKAEDPPLPRLSCRVKKPQYNVNHAM